MWDSEQQQQQVRLPPGSRAACQYCQWKFPRRWVESCGWWRWWELQELPASHSSDLSQGRSHHPPAAAAMESYKFSPPPDLLTLRCTPHWRHQEPHFTPDRSRNTLLWYY